MNAVNQARVYQDHISLDQSSKPGGPPPAAEISCEILPGAALTPQQLEEIVLMHGTLCVPPEYAAVTNTQAPLRPTPGNTLKDDIKWTKERLEKDSFVVAARDQSGELAGCSRVHCDANLIPELVVDTFMEKFEGKVAVIYDAVVNPNVKDTPALREKLVRDALGEINRRGEANIIVADVELQKAAQGDMVQYSADKRLFNTLGFTDSGMLTVVEKDPLILAAHYYLAPNGGTLKVNPETGNFRLE